MGRRKVENEITETSLLLNGQSNTTGYAGNRRTRSPPFTQLETLSSCSVWGVLMLPFMLALLTIFIDLNKSIHKESMIFSTFECSRPLLCETFNHDTLSVMINSQSANLHHIALKGKIFTSPSDEPMEKYGIQILVWAVNEDGEVTQTVLEVVKSSMHTHENSNYIPLSGFLTERPWLYEDSKYIHMTIKITDATSSPSSQLLDRMTFKLDFQSRWFTGTRAVLQIVISFITMYVLIAWSRRIALHHMRLRESARGLVQSSSFAASSSSYYCFVSYMVPEQIYTVVLLLSLVMWQDLPGSCFALTQLMSYDVSSSHLFFSSLVKLWGQQGLFLSLLLLSRSLGSVPTDSTGPARREAIDLKPTLALKTCAGSCDSIAEEDGGYMDGGEEWWADAGQSPAGGKSASSVSKCKSLSKRRSRGSISSATSRGRQSSRMSEGQAGWTYTFSSDEEDNASGVGTRETQRVQREGKIGRRRSSQGRTDLFRSPSSSSMTYGRTSVGRLSGVGMGGARGVRSSSESSGLKHFAICRSYGEKMVEEFPLVESHPCSTLFFNFIIGWIMLFLLFILIVTVQNIFTFPEVLQTLLAISMNTSLEQGLYSFFTLFLVPIRLIWIFLIWKALVESAIKLKAARYMNSRYQQVAFRLFVNQIMMGLGLLCATYFFQIYHFFVVMRKRMTIMTSLNDMWEAGIVVADNTYGGWGGRDAEIGELICVSCICYVIAFLFVTPNMEDYRDLYEHSEKGLAGTAHEYLVLEPLDYRTEEQQNISFEKYRRHHDAQLMALASDVGGSSRDEESVHSKSTVDTAPFVTSPIRRVKSRPSKRFCLETACVLMECSWQTYFLPLDEPRSEQEATARSASQDVFATALGTTVQCKMDVAQYGLTFVRSFLSLNGDISGYVARTDKRIILSFRGTVGGANMITDLNVIQTQLPDFGMTYSPLRDIFREVLKEGVDLDPEATHRQRPRTTNPFHEDFRPQSPDTFRSGSFSLPSKSEDGSVIGAGSASDYSESYSCSCSDTLTETSSKLSGHEEVLQDTKSTSSRLSKCLKSIIAMVPVARQTLPLVHNGFLQAYRSIREEFLKAVFLGVFEHYTDKKRAMTEGSGAVRSSTASFRHSTDGPFQSLDGLSAEFRYPLDVYVCGHSLGGALAVLAALDLQKNSKNIIRIVLDHLFIDEPVPISSLPSVALTLYTFGAPRIGNVAFSKLAERNIKDSFRVEVDGDLVCRIPRLLGMYRHCGVHIVVDSEETGNLIVNPTVVESQLLRRGSGTTDHHSLAKYRGCLEACFLPHELEEYLKRCFFRAQELAAKSPSRRGSKNHFHDDFYQKEDSTMPDWV